MASPQLDALLADDLHDAFRLMYDGVDTTFALDAAYAEEDEEIPLDNIAPDLNEATLRKTPTDGLKREILPRSRIRSVLDAALDLDDAARRPTYGYKKARIQDAYRRVQRLEDGPENERLDRTAERKRRALRAVLFGIQQGSTSTGDKEANLALVKLRTLLERRRGTMLPASVVSPSSPPASPALAPLSPAAYPYAPFSVAAYHARLLTFSARSWTPKYRISGGDVQGASRSGPNASEGVVTVVLGDTDTDTNTDPLRPAEAARHGWVNHFPTTGGGVALAGAKANVLCCAWCGVRWAVGCNAGELGALKQEWIDKLVHKTAEQYTLAHAAGCAWRRLPSPANIFDKLLPTYHPLLSRRLAQIAQSIDAQCLSLAEESFSTRSPLDERECGNLQRNLQASAEEESAISRHSAALAFFGWTPVGKSSGHTSPLDGSLECKLCTGGRLLRSDLRAQSPRAPLDLLRRHADHCPIVSTRTRDPRSKASVPWWQGQALVQDTTWASREDATERLRVRVQEGLESL